MIEKRKKVKRKDVADAAGVSGAMVSYAFSDNTKARISEDTRKRILRIASEMGYTPNFAGKSLVKGRSYNIGLVLRARYVGSISFHHLNIFHGLSLAIEQTDYNPIIFFGCGDKFYQKIDQRRLDGIVLIESGEDLEEVDRAVQTGFPSVVVNMDYDVSVAKNALCVRSDHEKLVGDSFEYFLANGCKRILCISASNTSNNYIIHDAFSKKSKEHAGNGVEGKSIIPGDNLEMQLRGMFEAGQYWDGFFIVGRSHVPVLLNVAREFDLVSGEDFRIFLLGNDSQHIDFQVDFPFYLPSQREMGRTAWQMLEKLISGNKLENRKVLIPYRPVEELVSHGHFQSDVDDVDWKST